MARTDAAGTVPKPPGCRRRRVSADRPGDGPGRRAGADHAQVDGRQGRATPSSRSRFRRPLRTARAPTPALTRAPTTGTDDRTDHGHRPPAPTPTTVPRADGHRHAGLGQERPGRDQGRIDELHRARPPVTRSAPTSRSTRSSTTRAPGSSTATTPSPSARARASRSPSCRPARLTSRDEPGRPLGGGPASSWDGSASWEDHVVLRWLTAGESHGPALVGVLEGLPAGVEVTSDDVGRRAGAPPARRGSRGADGLRAGRGRVPRRRTPRPDAGRAGRDPHRQHRVAEVGDRHVAGPGRP